MDNCSSENKSQFRLAEIASEVIPCTVLFKTQDHSKSTIDGLHTWVTTTIRTGNQRDRAQTLADAVEYLREEEQKKLYGTIKRYFITTKHRPEPRNGLINAFHNHLVRMCSYDEQEKRILLADIACACKSCVNGKFHDCEKHNHDIIKELNLRYHFIKIVMLMISRDNFNFVFFTFAIIYLLIHVKGKNF